jgi:hypothetical protein
MPAITPDIEATTQPIKGRRKMKKAKTMKSQDGFKQFAPSKNAGSAKYRKQVIKGPIKGKMSVAGAKYGGA